jgi:endonuclease/exonuclease/phosphatase family metal-dependent hydrolase
MRLVSYNILDGGEGRADPLAEVIEAQRPDIVALVEADNHAVVERIARRLKMEYVEAAGHRRGAALLSRWPIVESVNHSLLREGFSDAFLQATVHDDTGRDWIIGVTHLHPRAEVKDDLIRQGEIDLILDLFASERKSGAPHLLAGDFNADSPVQNIDPARCKPATQKVWQANGNSLPRHAVQKLLDAGYVDTLHALHPKLAGDLGSFTTQFPGQRLDYVFAFGFADRVKKAWIEQDRLAKFASDHFPVGVEID